MKNLSIDVESFSDVDLSKCGVYKYSESPDFDILLFGYAIDGGEVEVVDLASGEEIPPEVIAALVDDTVIKWAFNSQFERVCLSVWLRRNYPHDFCSYSIASDSVSGYLDPSAWRCTMIWSAYMGLPLSLEGVGAVLGLEDQKLKEGKDLIRYFCMPCKSTKANSGRIRNLPEHDQEKWKRFSNYNRRDVEVEIAIQKKLAKTPVPDFVWDEYHLDQEINDRGITLDMTFVEQAIAIDKLSREKLTIQMQELTNLDNPNSVQQMKSWLADNGLETDTLGKKAVTEMLKTAPDQLAEVLSLRQQLAKSSVKKYLAMDQAVCQDGRVRGTFQFYGANRTGRWAGRLIQLQNLPQNHIPDLEQARALVRSGNEDALSMLYHSVPEVLSELIRTAFIPRDGMKFIVADFSAIEARVLSWLAGESWRMDVFAENGDIYCATAGKMFHCNVVKHGENSDLRQKGKQAELACIAEGQLVLTNDGLVPIEKILIDHKLWDGENWVSHEGVVFKGEREVITYDGLKATADHLVWVEGQSQPIQFGIAAASGAHLIQTGYGGTAIRLGEDYFIREKMEQKNESLLCTDPVYRLRKHSVATVLQFKKREIKRMSKLFSAKADSALVGSKTCGSKTTLRKSQRCGLSQLWCKRNKICFCKCYRSRTLFNKHVWLATKRVGNRSDQQRSELCTGQSTICDTFREQPEQKMYSPQSFFSGILALCKKCGRSQIIGGIKQGRNNPGCRNSSIRKKKKLEINQCKARLYDIRNAGPHHRFTVSGKLVHNCGYGGSVGALKAMGALESGMQENELKPLVDAWRQANPNIVRFWWAVDRAVKECIKQKIPTETHGIYFSYQSGFLFITLPSGRKLAYVKPRIGENRFGGESVTYEGVGGTKKWERIESYGPKFVENIVQAISRDILAEAMKRLRYCFIVAHVHDEIIIEADMRMSLLAICEQMATTPSWAEGLLLHAEGYECSFYKKD